MPFLVELVSLCLNDDTEKHKSFTLPFEFPSEEEFEIHSDTGFDNLIELFNTGLPKGWYCDDTIEPVRNLDKRPKNCLVVPPLKN